MISSDSSDSLKDGESQMSKEVDTYIKSMSQKDYLAYTIAKEHLGSSFTVEKSVGFLKWKKTISTVG